MIVLRSQRQNRSAFIAAVVALLPVAALGASVDARTVATITMREADIAASVSLAELKSGLDALDAKAAGKARGIRDALPEQSLDRHILAWAIAIRGGETVPADEIADAAANLRGWPGAETMRRNWERALYRENPPAKQVISALGGKPPISTSGVILLARAHVAEGNPDAAVAVLSPYWRGEKLEASDEARIIREFGTLIPAADHRIRMERMLYAGRVASANRVAEMAGATQLTSAWTAVIRNDRIADKLLKAVPAEQRSAGYVFAEAKYLRRQKKFAEAAAIMLAAPTDRSALIDPDAWWQERRALSREMVDLEDWKTAYKLAAAHSAESPLNAADAEFHAGWYAFRGLGDAASGARHFTRIVGIGEGPITLSRAFYWLGRTAEAGGPGDASAYYRKAATFGSAFYGQLAAERLGGKVLNVADPLPTDAERLTFAGREAVNAIKRLEKAGYPALADRIYRELADSLDSPGELALLAGMAERRGNHFLALKVGKIAASRGVDIGALSHPVGAIPASANISGAGQALAYAIARQESEFNVGAVSGAGARGLLQLLPGTARDVAKRAGLAYSQARLTTDAGYNATLGAAFLGEQLGRFDGSYVLTFAGYNAGPRRAADWIKRYGDPRGKDIDTVVDWIERIPYAETRSYVQRVMENYQVYKMRLSGTFDIEGDLVNGR